jgi:hypothetical protein
MTNKSSPSSQKSMVVAINGEFEIQDIDDYTAKQGTGFHDDDHDDKKPSTGNTKMTYIPTPPTEAKQRQDPSKPQAPQRPFPSKTRPKSSDSSKRTDSSNSLTSRSWSDNKTKSGTNNQRPKRYNKSIYLYL